jgi:nickel transport protein
MPPEHQRHHRCGRSTRRLAVRLSAALVPLLLATAASGHALLHQVLEAESVVMQFSFADGDRPYFEDYRVLGPDDHRPFQSGRINAAGEISFRPDRPGPWRVIVATEDGHGAEIRVDVDPDSLAATAPRGGGLPQSARIVAGIGYLLGVFGIIALWRMYRARHRPA